MPFISYKQEFFGETFSFRNRALTAVCCLSHRNRVITRTQATRYPPIVSHCAALETCNTSNNQVGKILPVRLGVPPKAALDAGNWLQSRGAAAAISRARGPQSREPARARARAPAMARGPRPAEALLHGSAPLPPSSVADSDPCRRRALAHLSCQHSWARIPVPCLRVRIRSHLYGLGSASGVPAASCEAATLHRTRVRVYLWARFRTVRAGFPRGCRPIAKQPRRPWGPGAGRDGSDGPGGQIFADGQRLRCDEARVLAATHSSQPLNIGKFPYSIWTPPAPRPPPLTHSDPEPSSPIVPNAGPRSPLTCQPTQASARADGRGRGVAIN